MPLSDPFHKSKEDFESVIAHISLPNSPVGIDAQLTHAIIIDYLRQIHERLDRLEQCLNSKSR
jgi:hypothetical protein